MGRAAEVGEVRVRLSGCMREAERKIFGREGVDVGNWAEWDVTAYCKVGVVAC